MRLTNIHPVCLLGISTHVHCSGIMGLIESRSNKLTETHRLRQHPESIGRLITQHERKVVKLAKSPAFPYGCGSKPWLTPKNEPIPLSFVVQSVRGKHMTPICARGGVNSSIAFLMQKWMSAFSPTSISCHSKMMQNDIRFHCSPPTKPP